jgi:hypothetical protein
MSPTQLYPEINCIAPYILYDICNLIPCIGKFHIRRDITPTDQTSAKYIEIEIVKGKRNVKCVSI